MSKYHKLSEREKELCRQIKEKDMYKNGKLKTFGKVAEHLRDNTKVVYIDAKITRRDD